jgi:hypothetical protein
MTEKPVPPYERPAVEPEILPPNHPHAAWNRFRTREGGLFSARYGQRIYVGRVGPLGVALFIALVILIAAAVLVFVIGALLVWIPVIALLAVAGIVLAWLRRYFTRLD